MKTETWNGHSIRFIQKDGEWWAVAKDLTDALGFARANTGTRNMPAHYKGVQKVRTLGGEQEMLILNERGVYHLIMRSNKPEAVVFQDWVYGVLKTLREATGLEGFEVFRMLDKEHQKEAMKQLRDGLKKPVRVDFIKANTIANKAVSTRHGYPKMLKKQDMNPKMLQEREAILADTVELMTMRDRFGLDFSVSEAIYSQTN